MEILPFLLNSKKGISLLLLFLLGLSIGRFSASIAGRFLESDGYVMNDTLRSDVRSRSLRAESSLVLKRNIFGAANQTPLEFEGEGSLKAQTANTSGSGDLQLCGTVVSSAAPFAIIRSNNVTEIYEEGDLLPGGGRVDRIFRNQVRLLEGGTTVLLLIDEGEETPLPVQMEGRLFGGIKEVGGDRWIIDRRTADAARQNIAELLKSARIEPNVTGGRTDGFVVKMIRTGSLLAQIGLRVGDVIRRVNGLELDSPEKALQIFQQLREAKNLSLRLERNGTPLSFEYQID